MANYADSYGIAAAAAAQWWSYPGAMDNNIQNLHNVPSPNSIMVIGIFRLCACDNHERGRARVFICARISPTRRFVYVIVA